MNMFLLVSNILLGLIAINSEFPVVYSHQTYLGDEDNASIQWPVVEGDFEGIERISEILDYQNITGETLEETRLNFELYSAGIVGSSFKVNWMNTEYLDLTIVVETLGAYPSRMVFNNLLNLESGELVIAEDLFLENQIDNLVALCDRELQNRIPVETTDEYHFTREDLDLLGMNRSGIIFHYDFHFNHATDTLVQYDFHFNHPTEALELNGELFFYWSDINNYLKPELRR